MIDKLLANGNYAIHRVATKTVMSTILVLTAFAIVPLTYGAVTPGINQRLFMWVIIGLIAFDLLVYRGFAVFSPNRLQSEEFVLEKDRMTLLGDERHRGAVVIDAEVIPNPLPIDEKRAES